MLSCFIIKLKKCQIENGNIGIINCFDGANHMVKQNSSKSVLSFNAQLFTKNTVDTYGSTSSGSIFTWKQVLATEN